MPGPRADYACDRCKKEFQDLPVGTVACPDCSKSSWWRRIWTPVAITTGAVKRAERDIGQVFDRERAPREAGKEVTREMTKLGLAPQFGVPMNKVGDVLGGLFRNPAAGAAMAGRLRPGKAEAIPQALTPPGAIKEAHTAPPAPVLRRIDNRPIDTSQDPGYKE